MDWRKLFFWRKPAPYVVLDKYDRRNQRDGDLLVIKRLREEGADLSQKREVLHYLYLPSMDLANQAAQELRTEGYNVEQVFSRIVTKTHLTPGLCSQQQKQL